MSFVHKKRGVKKNNSYRKSEKGLSTIVANLLIILLVLIAIAIIWIVVRNVLQNNAEQISLGKFTLSLEIKSISRDVGHNSMNVKIKRNPGEGELSGISFIADNGNNTEIINVENISLNPLEQETYDITLNPNMNVSYLEILSIAPIFISESGKKIIGNIADTYTFSPYEILIDSNPPNSQSNGLSYLTCNDASCVDSCQTLSVANSIYLLNSSVNSIGTCFVISASNIILDCNGSSITYSTGGVINTYGVYTNQLNTTIRNCNIIDGNWTTPGLQRYGIYFNHSNKGALINNIVTTSSGRGISMVSSSNNIITSNTIGSNTSYGIALYSFSLNNVLTNNVITSSLNNGVHIFQGSDNNVLTNNIVNSGGNGNGIYIYNSSSNNLTDNIANALGSGIGIYISTSSNKNNLINNIGKGNLSLGIWMVSSSNNILTGNTGTSNAGGITISSSSNNTFTNNRGISTSGYGIYIGTSNNNTLTNNIAISNITAIYITQSSNNTLINNLGTSYDEDGTSGIYLYNSPNNTLISNNGTSILGPGIELTVHSNNNILTNNIGKSNQYEGIRLESSNNNILTSNTARSDEDTAIDIYTSLNNTLIGQTAIGGVYGLYIYQSNDTISRDCGAITGSIQNVFISPDSVGSTFTNCPH